MTTDLEDQLATYFDWVEQSQPVAHTVATPPAHATAHPANARSHGERPTRWVLLAAAAVVAIVVAGLVALVRGPDTSAPSGPATAPTSTAPAPVREPFVPGAPAGGRFRFDLPAARLNSVVEVDVAVPLADGSADYVWADLAADPVRGMYVHVHAPLGPDESLPVPPDEGSPVDAPTGAAWFADVGLFHRLYWQQPDGTVLEAYESQIDGRGMQYQALAAEGAVRAGDIAGDLLPLPVAESVAIMGTLDEIRRQIGVRYPSEGAADV